MQTNAQKRVLIAKDVIKNLKANKIRAAEGAYARFYEPTFGVHSFKPSCLREQIKEKPELVCQCCALGSAFYSYIMKYNNFVAGYGQNYFNEFSMEVLETIFTKRQLDLIESAFEGQDRCIRSDDTSYFDPETGVYNDATLNSAIRFGRKHHDVSKRLEAIMGNIIKNKGVFKV